MRLTQLKHFGYRALLVPIVALAPILVCANVQTDAANPLEGAGISSLAQLLVTILDVAILVIFPVVVLMIVYTGMLFVTAQGNPAKISAARSALLWTVIGALVVLGSKALALAIEATVEDIKAGAYAPLEKNLAYEEDKTTANHYV